jgi:hypothetical protein
LLIDKNNYYYKVTTPDLLVIRYSFNLIVTC